MSTPLWLRAALKVLDSQEHADLKKKAWEGSARVAITNGKGFVTLSYNVETDETEWVFANGRWPRLINPTTGNKYKDDPFLDRRDDVPLAEFLTYLNDWYFPRQRHPSEKVMA